MARNGLVGASGALSGAAVTVASAVKTHAESIPPVEARDFTLTRTSPGSLFGKDLARPEGPTGASSVALLGSGAAAQPSTVLVCNST